MANYDLNGRLKVSISGSVGGGGGGSTPQITYPNIQGFQTSDLANIYQSNAIGVCPGADNFIAVGLCFPFDNRNSGGYQLLLNNFYQSGPNIYGWGIFWNYGVISVGYIRNDGSNGTLELSSVSQTNWNDIQKKGTFHAIGLRLYGAGAGSAGTLEIWINGCMFLSTVAGGNGILRVNTGGNMSLGGGGLYFQELPMNGGVCGFGYYQGTVTTDLMREIMIDSYQIGKVPAGKVAWNVIANGSQMVTTPSSFTSTVGSVLFNKVGSPTAINLGGTTL